jgi:hypothetical protein
MQFQYQISQSDYVGSMRLLWKLQRGRRIVSSAVGFIVVGAGFIFIAVDKQRVADIAPLILVLGGAWYICAGLRSLFPGWYLRDAFNSSELSGKQYLAEVDEQGVGFTGDMQRWWSSWASVRYRGEAREAFTLATSKEVYIFPKRFLNAEQQSELRTLARMPERPDGL